MLLVQPILLFVSLASAAAVRPKSVSTKIETYCQTTYASIKPRNVPTKTKTVSHSFTVTRTSVYTPSTTITPAASTTTSTDTTTTTLTSTADQVTDTTSITSTETSTEVTTDITTTTDSTTVTVTATTTSSGTSTVGTVAGFTPVASDASVVNNGGGQQVPVSKRDASLNDKRTKSAQKTTPKNPFIKSSNGFKCKARYPVCVDCRKNVDVYYFITKTITASQTKTITATTPPPSTVVTTETDSTTTTITPADATATASTTLTETTTQTTSSTVVVSTTSTTTTTTTSLAPVATVYAACSSDNIIDAVGNTQLVDFRRPGNGQFVGVSGINSPKDCCVSCQQNSQCLAFGYSLEQIQYGCLLITSSEQCDPTVHNWQFFNNGAEGQIAVGNGNCGQGTYLTNP